MNRPYFRYGPTLGLPQADLEDPVYVPAPYLGRRAWEKQLMSYITMGNPALLEAYLRSPPRAEDAIVVGTMSREALTQGKYMVVAVTAMACRTAIDAGLPEQLSFRLSDELIQEADRMLSTEQLAEHIRSVIRVYCRAVETNRLEQVSAPVRKCCEYMTLRLRGSITLKELSGVCHLSEHYISDLFRKELGMGALQYFHDGKLRYARHLVLHSAMTITQIASYLSYPSASNFTQRFRRTYGVPPLEYRKHPPTDPEPAPQP